MIDRFLTWPAWALLVVAIACTASQRRVIYEHEIQVDRDCRKLDANPLTPNAVRLSCDTGEIMIDIVTTAHDLAALDGGTE